VSTPTIGLVLEVDPRGASKVGRDTASMLTLPFWSWSTLAGSRFARAIRGILPCLIGAAVALDLISRRRTLSR
jgi:hypothetical protein